MTKQIFSHTLKYWPLYSLLGAVIAFYVTFMVFKAKAEANIDETANLRADVSQLQQDSVSFKTDFINVKTSISHIEKGVDSLTEYLLKNKK